jgi:hypothetical protein
VLVTELADGWWSLTVRGADERSGQLAFEVGAETREQELELALRARVNLAGRVELDGLQAPAHLQVALVEDLERLAGRSFPEHEAPRRLLLWVQDDGTFTVGGLEPGPWRAELIGERVWSEPVRFDPADLDGRELLVRARPGGELVVQVEGESGALGARLWLRAPDGKWSLSSGGVQLFVGGPQELRCSGPPGPLEWRVELVGEQWETLGQCEGNANLRAGEETFVRCAANGE